MLILLPLSFPSNRTSGGTLMNNPISRVELCHLARTELIMGRRGDTVYTERWKAPKILPPPSPSTRLLRVYLFPSLSPPSKFRVALQHSGAKRILVDVDVGAGDFYLLPLSSSSSSLRSNSTRVVYSYSRYFVNFLVGPLINAIGDHETVEGCSFSSGTGSRKWGFALL